MHDIATPCDRAQCSGAVETTIDVTAAMATQGPRPITAIRFAVRSYEFPTSRHRLRGCQQTLPDWWSIESHAFRFLLNVGDSERCSRARIAAEVSSG